MKLLLSVTLLGIFFISAEGLQCCTDSSCSSVTCSTETMCITASIVETAPGSAPVFSSFRGCASPSQCLSTGSMTFSVDLGVSGRFVAADCCDADNCNNLPLPSAIPPESPSGLECLLCVFDRCDVSFSCEGEEDRCIQGNDIMGNPFRGCASASLCQSAQIDEDLGKLQVGTECCDTDRCNDGTPQGFQCLTCTDSACSILESMTCTTETMCTTASSTFETRTAPSTIESSVFRGCASSSLCPTTGSKTYSVELGLSIRSISAECCDTANCNSQAFPNSTPPQSLNGLQCFFCAFGHCGLIVDCKGEQDRCILGTDMLGNSIRGCASSSVCQAAQIDDEEPFFEKLGEVMVGTTCCDTPLCNNELQCLACTDSTCSNVDFITCTSETMCITASSTFETRTAPFTTELSFFRGCASSSLCPSTGPKTFSVDLFLSVRSISAECCATDNCNSQAFPNSTPPQSLNGLQCFFCAFGHCGLIVDCKGEEDRCILGTDMSGNPIRGCASASVCPPAQIDGGTFFEDLGEVLAGSTCCDTDLCNDALQCLSCADEACSTIETVPSSSGEMCITASIRDTAPDSSTRFYKGRASSSVCSSTGPKTFSVDLGRSARLISAECCDTDNCNFQTLASPTPPQSENGLRCFLCDSGLCNTFIVGCQGEENKCIQGTDVMGNQFRGCASASVCQPTQADGKLPFFENLGELQGGTTCCDTDLCNDGTPQGFQCLSCTDSTCSNQEYITCPTETSCITATIFDTRPALVTQPRFFRGCASSAVCSSNGPRTFSVDLGSNGTFTSAECCDTPNCNFQAFPSPTPSQSVNGLQCHLCIPTGCGIIINCLGEADTCIRGTDMSNKPVAGCVSASTCQAAQIDGVLPFLGVLVDLQGETTCCDTAQCNNGVNAG